MMNDVKEAFTSLYLHPKSRHTDVEIELGDYDRVQQRPASCLDFGSSHVIRKLRETQAHNKSASFGTVVA